MKPNSQSAPQSQALPEFRIADPETWPGDPDFHPADLVLKFPEYAEAKLWSPQGGGVTELRTSDEFTAFVDDLWDNRFGVLKGRDESRTRFAQTLRVGETWIVEVHDGTEQDWASRVPSGERTVPAELLDPAESFTARAAADIMWSWMLGTLLSGLHLERLR